MNADDLDVFQSIGEMRCLKRGAILHDGSIVFPVEHGFLCFACGIKADKLASEARKLKVAKVVPVVSMNLHFCGGVTPTRRSP